MRRGCNRRLSQGFWLLSPFFPLGVHPRGLPYAAVPLTALMESLRGWCPTFDVQQLRFLTNQRATTS